MGAIREMSLGASPCRQGLNDPPTAVGGIREMSLGASPCRLDLNDPPTAVGGILVFAFSVIT